ncbi:MAG: MATE family efflux transporter [Clostridium sp.]|uniref:MATE family efflux transporter n=1 Tax=Clostridium sp. TaxID=1506 RepID=UPI00306DFD23
MKDNILGTEKIPKLFVMYSIPAIIAMLIVGTQSIIDGLFVGNFVGENAMASVNIAQPFTQIIVASAMVIVIGSLSYMGRSLGENNKIKTQNIYRTSLILLVIVASILTIAGFFFSKEIALALGASEILVEDTSIYIKTMSIFLVPMFLMYQFAFTNRLLEKPDLYFKGMILSLITNIFLNIILVKYMNLGVLGTAIATGLAEPTALFYVIWPHLDRKNTINIFVGKYDKSTIIPVIANGASEGMASIAAAITGYVFNMAFMKASGEIGIAAFTIVSYFNLFATYIIFGISDGIGAVVSYSYGAKDFNRVKEVMKFSYIVAFVIGAIIFIVLLFWGQSLVSLFIRDNEAIIQLATVGAKIFAFGYLISGFNILSSGYFTSIGLAKESVIIALSRGLVFILIGILILPRVFKINGILMVVPFAEFLTAGVCYYLLKVEDGTAI